MAKKEFDTRLSAAARRLKSAARARIGKPKFGGAVALWLVAQFAAWALADNELMQGAARRLDAKPVKTNSRGKEKFTSRFAHRNPVLTRNAIIWATVIASIVGGNKIAKLARDFDAGRADIENVVAAPVAETFEINTISDLENLYNHSRSLIRLVLLPTETINLKSYSDNGKKLNTIGVGSWLYPADGNWKNRGEWPKVSQNPELKKKSFHIDMFRAFNLIDGWAKYRENGLAMREMFNNLRGVSLTANQFAAIFSCYYNNPANGREVCRFVRDNIADPVACANFIARCLPRGDFGGLPKRRAFEAMAFLNTDNIFEKIPDMKTLRTGNVVSTSVTALDIAEFDAAVAQLADGDAGGLSKLLDKMMNYYQTRGETVSDELFRLVGNRTSETVHDIINAADTISFDNATASLNDGR
ncbi:MAG: hypothetical protein LBR41_02705 [Rickettsiales bacterium]|jgi:hypothetical protein|nr:hypothetical protein [Rickettsiales bacterium]